jgi:UDPglucose 6-dehydrogenase
MRIGVIGTGYVGLVTAACFAELGHDVVAVDIDRAKVESLRMGHIPIYEPGLPELVTRGRETGKLEFTTSHAEAAAEADLIFVAVGSPTTGMGEADLSQVVDSIEQIAPVVADRTVVVIKSTVPVGTNADMAAMMDRLQPDLEVEIAANPEFLRQGSAVEDFMRPDRIVIGARSDAAARLVRDAYAPLIATEAPPVLLTDVETAELIKYTSNAFLAVKLSFINEIADLCEQAGASIADVAAGVGLDPRIGARFLQAGPGFGGSCLPKDTQALLHTSRMFGTPSRIVAAAVDVNRERKHSMVTKIADAVDGDITDATIAILGITFKADTDDLRESPAVDLVRGLVGLGASVRVYDPQGMDRAREILPNVEYEPTAYAAMDGADVAVIATEWPEFSTLDLEKVRTLLGQPTLIDLRNLYGAEDVTAAGIEYISIGRPREFPKALQDAGKPPGSGTA